MKKIFLLLFAVCLTIGAMSQPALNIIPTPQHVFKTETYTLAKGQPDRDFCAIDAKTMVLLSIFYVSEEALEDNDELFATSTLRETVQELLPDAQLPVSYDGERTRKTCEKNLGTVIECFLWGYLPGKYSELVERNQDQAYILTITPYHIQIDATSSTGIFYAMQTLRQLCRACLKDGQVKLPLLTIVDYPAMEYRGWMDDISRGPIISMDLLKKAIRTYAEYKINFFNLYTEHVFVLDQYPDIAPTDGLTAAEIRELEEYAEPYHIEIFGNQQCFAHAEKTLRIPFYQDMADTRFNLNPGVKKTYDFLDYQLTTVAKAYKSPYFNIDCDETEGLGTGKAADFVAREGAGMAYVNHINRVYDILKKQDKRVMMWGDIAAKDSVIVNRLPKDMTMIVWSYAPSDSYVDMMQPFTKKGFEFFVAPGMSLWGTVFPCQETYIKNIANMVRDGYQNGAKGMMNTAWDDSGESLFNSVWHGMMWGAEMSWKPIQNTEVALAEQERADRLAHFNKGFETQFFTGSTETMAKLSMLEKTAIPDFFQSGTMYESLVDFYPTKVSEEFYQENVRIYDELDALKGSFAPAKDMVADEHNALTRFGYYTCLRAQWTAERNILRYKLYHYLREPGFMSQAQLQADIDRLFDGLNEVKNCYLRLWNEESRAYSRDIVEARFNKVAQELLNLPYHVFVETTPVGNTITEVTLRTLFPRQPHEFIYYSLDGRDPQAGGMLYEKPVALNASTLVKAMCYNTMREPVVTERYVLQHKGLGRITKLNTPYATYRLQYAASGLNALADGIVGGASYADGTWQGYWGEDIDAAFDFGSMQTINTFQARFMQNGHDWVLAPETIELYISKDGVNYTLFKTITVQGVTHQAGVNGIFSAIQNDLNLKTRYVRVVVKNAGPLPSWHVAAGQPSYIFADEFVFE